MVCLKLNCIYNAPTAKKPTNRLLNLNLYLSKLKLTKNSKILYNLLINISSLERLNTDNTKQTKVNNEIFKEIILLDGQQFVLLKKFDSYKNNF